MVLPRYAERSTAWFCQTGATCRISVSSDLPMLDSVIIEVPNPKHPQGVRGVGEVPLVPPLGAVSNAIYNALGRRFYSLPMSPPKVLATLDLPQAAE